MSALTVAVQAAADALCAHADELSRLDAVAGDGDLGQTATIAAGAVTEVLASAGDDQLAPLLSALGVALARNAPSTAGTLVATGFLGAARAAKDLTATGTTALAELFGAACEAIAKRGKAEAGQKTMLDALLPASRRMREVAEREGSVAEAVRAGATAADEGARSTVEMVPQFGRASWLRERAAGNEDAGARLVAIALAHAASALEKG